MLTASVYRFMQTDFNINNSFCLPLQVIVVMNSDLQVEVHMQGEPTKKWPLAKVS